MRIRWTAAMAIAALVLGISFGLSQGGGTAHAAKVTFEGTATSSNEVPSCSQGGATAFVRFIWDDTTNKIDYAVTVSGVSPDLVTAAHIHRGAAGVAGPVIYPLSTTGFTQISGTVDLKPEDVADLRAGNLYFNVHSKDCAGGFARLQLTMPAATAAPTAPARAAGAPAAAGAAAAPAVRAPSTGDGGLAARGSSSSLPLAGIALLTLSGFGALAVIRRRV